MLIRYILHGNNGTRLLLPFRKVYSTLPLVTILSSAQCSSAAPEISDAYIRVCFLLRRGLRRRVIIGVPVYKSPLVWDHDVLTGLAGVYLLPVSRQNTISALII